ncbi:MAG: cobyrinate a,c-diamide synthase [Lachnospiraceae bacterium]|uniref:cobyrinate a,c-diamide synthase n=1 Tax=Roseburia hominis TaxID=301301 RepID=UPI001F2E5ACB|nr:cobyrinate a,c-diamide synthase [Roseburia hominis]MCI5713609.1 cobyrinate a,c-diamide synthase [Lachnospiraceae bacterium]MDD6169454.1 cobyrinate a,c-diamide synthase [Lachnospiraceae bacterium]MDY4839904.1 cobyrinate a,c-diamide synthase [Lachnospiraceae bacterium]
MKLKRIMIAAPKSGSGKTTITCALLKALKDSGESVVSYKCGPDYIDPMFHQKVIGIPSKNLDTFFTGAEETKRLFLKNRTENEFAVLEGVMGLYDGLGGILEEGSSYHLAKVTKTPVILVIDAKGMGRSIISLIAGFLAYDKEHLIKGVIFNRMSKPYYQTIKSLVEEELKICVLGYFPEQKQLHIDNRHLGLRMPDELENIQTKLQMASLELQKTISLKLLMQIAENAENLECSASKSWERKSLYEENPVIAVARDEAFCFYYEDNLLLLQDFGAKIEYFSPLHDTKLPEECDGLLLGGGYPELYAKKLSENQTMQKAIKKEMDNGIPVVAECGGFMYLHSMLMDKENHSYPMVGTLAASCYDTGKLVRFGYIEIEEKQSDFLPEGERIKGHEFHYFDSEDNGNDCIAVKPVTGKSYPCIISDKNIWMGFPHLYYPSNPNFAKSFVKKANEFKKRKRK